MKHGRITNPTISKPKIHSWLIIITWGIFITGKVQELPEQ